MTIPLSIIDAFTDRPFSGNPAAVCLLPAWKEDSSLQSVACEMNLSETAFLVKQPDHYDLRWFTPQVEVDLCGHATLAAAHFLWETNLVFGEEIHFSTRSGLLKAHRRDNEIELDFPLKRETEVEPPAGLLSSLGVKGRYVGKNQFDYLVEVESEQILRTMRPDFKQLAALPVRGIIVTSISADSRYDFISRFFAPAAGVDEDPVTGSAHCCLADYWRKRLGKTTFTAYQASRRGGNVKVRISNDRVFLGGTAVTVTRGELCLP